MSRWDPNSNDLPFWTERENMSVLSSLSEEEVQIIVAARLRDMENIRIVSVYSVLPLVFLSFLGGYVIATVMLNPLETLNSTIKKRELENIDEEIPFDDNGDEISELIKSFNRMSNRLGKSFDSQKQFIENASHELKTPLAVVSANTDMILDDESITLDEVKDLASSSKRQIAFMNDLTEDLLLMSVKNSIKCRKMDILPFLRDLATSSSTDEFKVLFNDKFRRKQMIFVNMNKVLLERACMNIVENSIKYSGGNELVISLEKKRKELYIHFVDNGKGIPEESKEKVFDRFYRVDKGRCRDCGGSGLGLSISRKIIELHGGRVYLNKVRKDGAEFIVVLKTV